MAGAEAGLEKVQERPVIVNRRFWRGVLTGVFGVVLVLSAIGYYTLNVRGLSIFIDRDQLATAVRARLQERAAEDFPAMVAAIADRATGDLLGEGEAPRLVMEVAGRRMELPAETAGILWGELRKVAKESVDATVRNIDLSPYANQLADEVYQMVQETLDEEIYGKTFQFQANRWLSVPVTVQGKPQS